MRMIGLGWRWLRSKWLLLSTPFDQIIAGHRFFTIPRRTEFILPRDGTPVYCIFGTTRGSLNSIGNFFRGVPVIFVQMTRRQSFTKETLQIIEKIGPAAMPVFVSEDALSAVAAKSPGLAARGALAVLSPIDLVSRAVGVEALWLRPVTSRSVDVPEPTVDAFASFFRSSPLPALPRPPGRVLATTSEVGVEADRRQMELSKRLEREGDGGAASSILALQSPLMLDLARGTMPRNPSISFPELLDMPRATTAVWACDEALAAGLTLFGFDVRCAPAPSVGTGLRDDVRMSEEDARGILRRALGESRLVATSSRRTVKLADLEYRLGGVARIAATDASLPGELLAAKGIGVDEAGALAKAIADKSFGHEAKAALTGFILREGAKARPMLLERTDLVDVVLDLASTVLEPQAQPSVIKLRLRIDGDQASAVDDLQRLIRSNGASVLLLDAIATVFSDVPEVILPLAQIFAKAGGNRAALSLLQPAAREKDAPLDLLYLLIEVQLELGLSDEAVGTGERIIARDPVEPTIVEAVIDAGTLAGGDRDHSSSRPIGLLMQARAAQDRGDMEAAEALLRRAAAIGNTALSSAASEELTSILLAQKQLEEAVAIAAGSLDQAVGRMRDGAAIMLSEVQMLAGSRSAALETLRAAEASGSRVAGSRLRGVLVRGGDLGREIYRYASLHGKKPTLNTMSQLMQMLAIDDRLPEARAIAEQTRRGRAVRPEDIALVEAELLVQHLRFQEAVEVLEPHFKSASRQARIALQLGQARLALAEYAEAKIALRIAEQAPGTRNLAVLYLARLAEAVGASDEAALHYTEVLSRNALSPVYCDRWANALRQSGQLQTVKGALEKEATHSVEARVFFWLSHLAAQEGHLDQLIGWAKRAAELEPLNINIARHYVEALMAVADQEQACAVIDRLAEKTRRRGVRFVEVANLYRSIGQMERAIEVADLAVKSMPRNPAVLQIAARIHFENENFTVADDLVRVSLHIDPARLGSYGLQARIARRLGRTGEADALTTAAMRIWPDRTVAVSMMLEQAIANRDVSLAREGIRRLRLCTALQGDRLPLRLLWATAVLFAEANDVPVFVDLAGDVLRTIEAALPETLATWQGESLERKAIMVIARGGPGDEVRLYSSALRPFHSEAETLVHIGDHRLETIFRRNFPDARFVPNPWAGRRLNRSREAIRKVGDRSMTPGTLEATRRLGLYVPRDTLAAVDYVSVADAVVTRRLFSGFGNTVPRVDPRPLVAAPEYLDRMQAFLDGLPPGPRVGISWRASYISANRFSGGFFEVEELAELLGTPGAVFVDLHPNVFDEEFARSVTLTGGRFFRPDVDLYNDFEAIAALSVLLDAIILPGVTQRDIAGAFRERDIWSFNLAREYSERWRIGVDERDQFQPSILHHDTTVYGDRAGIARELTRKVSLLVGKQR
jgi:tetratricopeptide (TPR) repeat protein